MMKKAICILLAVVVMMSCSVIGVSAKCTIGETLQARMDAAAEDESIRVSIWIHPIYVSDDEIHRQAMADAGYKIWEFDKLTSAQMSRYIIARRAIECAMEDLVREQFIEKYSIPEDCINYHLALCINADLTKAQILQLATCSEVDCIYYDDSLDMVFTHPTEVSAIVPTEALSSASPYLYQARFEELYGSGYDRFDYQELYYHTDQNNELDWVLVYGMVPMSGPVDFTTIVGNRVLHPGTMYMPFDACYGIYDVKEDKFIDAGSADAKNYDGFLKVFDEIDDGRLIGDLDRDGDLSVIDVTILQRCEANMREYPDDDTFSLTFEWGKSRYYSDFDRDGERSILDVTCLQRYLIGK